MQHKAHKLQWQEHKNGITIDCDLDVAITPSKSEVVVLIVPGVDGSVDGYEDKYKRIAETLHKIHGAAIVRISNPFISSLHWESNVRNILNYIETNSSDITTSDKFVVKVMAHSAGASVVAQVTNEYPYINHLLLINPASKLNIEGTKKGLNEFNGKIDILLGEEDPSLDDFEGFEITVVKGADHNFSGEAFTAFLNAPNRYFFGTRD